ncbi:START domain-containing protein [Acinetobacter guerrae]|uniref:START domain-containing protein n=1 Tax=Acinetobacter guerrae TaxID=1843371 RepID=UPI00148F2ACA
MNNKSWMLACTLSLSSFMVHAVPANEAKLSLDKNNIKVWTYQTENNPVIQYKAETTFDVPIEQAVGLILNVEHAAKWVPYVSETKVLSRDDKKGEFILYMVLDFPFPLKDRDLVVKGKISKTNNGIISIRNNAVTGYYPIQKDRLRLNKYEGDWTFQKLGANKVKVTTSGYADPAGSIPLSFVNMFVQQQPYQMLMKMKIELQKPANSLVKLPDILK